MTNNRTERQCVSINQPFSFPFDIKSSDPTTEQGIDHPCKQVTLNLMGGGSISLVIYRELMDKLEVDDLHLAGTYNHYTGEYVIFRGKKLHAVTPFLLMAEIDIPAQRESSLNNWNLVIKTHGHFYAAEQEVIPHGYGKMGKRVKATKWRPTFSKEAVLLCWSHKEPEVLNDIRFIVYDTTTDIEVTHIL